MSPATTDPPFDCLLFDVGGSVFDWQTAIVSAVEGLGSTALDGVDPAEFAATWRRRSLVHMYDIAEERVAWRPFGAFIDDSLTEAIDECDVGSLSVDERATLLRAWWSMPAWAEVPSAIARLRERFVVAPHSILSLAAVAQSSKAAGLTWDAIVSCDALGATKTNPTSYERGAAAMGFAHDRICYVAAHTSDLEVVRTLGMRTAYVASRLDEYGEDPLPDDAENRYDVIASDYADLADQLVT